ncbi:hypothetical protein [Phnomibacter ginsenosidimutans]|uniref:Uncharacterized protein n=1 Tax=Phnomibacter ginsenosidimutans TaxID=2676868 RepID=A0A6I6GKZ4_9BACT|nr:hypothetical protein [Phnomibacter ginsenosidimutans]QGW28308.1 hypothetical protein GLV81_09535 [Phnomibacter ginsenosidimutans]
MAQPVVYLPTGQSGQYGQPAPSSPSQRFGHTGYNATPLPHTCQLTNLPTYQPPNPIAASSNLTPKSQKTIIDLFITPNQWIFAQSAFAHRIQNSGFPFLNTDTLTLVAAYENHQLIAVKEMICSNPNSFNLPDNLLAQIHTLPDMVASPPPWSTE